MTKRFIIIATLTLILGIGFYLSWENRAGDSLAKPEQQEEISNTPESTSTNLVEDLVKKSANEMVEPDKINNGANTGSGSVAAICTSQTTFSCYEDHYKALVKNKGVAVAFADLKSRYDQDSYLKSQCHPAAHVIGNSAVELYTDVGIAYTKGDSFCWSGYYHGVMEGIVGKISIEELPNKLNGICFTVPGKTEYSFDYYNCVHGLGHGVMAITQSELFDSLKLCDNLAGGWEQQSCYGGVFMQNIIIDNKNHFTKYLKPDDPLYPCNAVDDRYKGTCYLMQTSYMLKVTNSDFSKVFDLCSAVGNFAATCYQSLGRDASGRSISNVETTKVTCGLGKDYDQQSNCIVGAVKDFISYHHSDVQAKELCTSLKQDLQAICNSTAESYYQNFKKS